MKRVLAIFLVVLCLCASLASMSGVSMAAGTEPSRVINVVYDDSGSMIETGGVKLDTWCKAKYSMEVFAAMLGENDSMNIYYMSDYDEDTSSSPRIVLKGADGAASNVSKIHNATITRAWGTPFNAVRKAYSDICAASADEKWLVILTDGAFDDMEPSQVDDFLSGKPDDVKVMFLSMGPNAAGITQNESQNIFCEKASENKEILEKITTICTRIFNSNRLEVNVSSKSVSFDVPMGELIVFAQGANVDIEGITDSTGKLYKSSTAPVVLQYSEVAATNYEDVVVDRDLLGCISTFHDDFDSGSYSLNVTGAETIEIYYKPNVDVAAYLTDSNGNEVTDLTDIESGEYTITFGFVKAGTKEKVSESKLLGDITYEATIINNGEMLPGVYSNGDKVVIEEGTLAIDVTASYLDYNSTETHIAYDVFRNKSVDFTITDNPQYTIVSEGFERENRIVMEMQVDGQDVTAEEWAVIDVPNVEITKKSGAKIDGVVIEKANDPGVFYLHPTLPGGEPTVGTYENFDYSVTYSQGFGNATWSGNTSSTVKLNDTRPWWERNWDLVVKLLVLLALIIIAIGYLPGVKKYLPKKLKQKPLIDASPKVPGQEHNELKGLYEKNTLSTIIPYIPQRGTIRFVPKGTPGVPKLQVRGTGNKKMTLTNTKAYAGKENITFNGISVLPDTRRNMDITAGVTLVVEAPEWTYTCQPNRSI